MSDIKFDIADPPGRAEEISKLENYILNNKNTILLGARRVGKTTLLKAIEVRKKEEYNLLYYDCEKQRSISHLFAHLFSHSKKLKFFVSSVGKKDKGELADERKFAEECITNQRYDAFLIENHASTDQPLVVEEKNIKDSDVFLLILGKEEGNKNVKEEFEFALEHNIPILCMIKGPSEDDEKRGKTVQEIISQIRDIKKEKGEACCLYHRYYSMEEFKNTLKESIERNKDEWIQSIIKKYGEEKFREIGDKFFKSVNRQDKKKFLILIDELGELKKDKKNNFEDFLAYLKGKINENSNTIFILTGSENVFTLSNQKYFSSFEISMIKPFDNSVGKEVLKKLMKTKVADIFLDEIIARCGTLPADIEKFVEKFEEIVKKRGKDDLMKVIIDTTKTIIKDEGFRIEKLFFENLNDGTKRFLEAIIPHLPATKDTMKTYFPSKNFDEILKKITDEYIILEEKENKKYDTVSGLLKLSVIKRTNPDEFEKIIKKLRNN